MTLPLADIAAALWERVATDGGTAPNAVRALLSDGGVLTAAQLEGGAASLVAPPFVVWREGPVAGSGDVMRTVFGAWWVYVPDNDTRRQAQIIEAIEACYTPFCIALGRVEVGPIGQAAPDKALGGLLARPLTVSYIRR